MKAWLKERLTERNSQRAIGVALAIGGYFHFIDPEALTRAGAVVGSFGVVWLAVEAFRAPDPSKPPTEPAP